MASRIVESSFPDVNHALRFLHAHYPRAYDIDRTAGTHAIRQQLDNLQDAGSLFDAIIYQKAPIVIRELETRLGAEAFREGLREYLREHRFGNASWPDLLARLDARLPSGLAAWSRAWIDEGGRPIVRTELTVARGRISELAFTTHDARAGRALTWSQDLQLVLGYEDHVELLPVRLDGIRTVIPAACDRPAPLFVLANGGGIGYGEFHPDVDSLRWLSHHLPDIGDPLMRGSAWITLWDQVLCGRLPASGFLALAVRALPRETDELNVQHVLSSLVRAYWTFTPDADRRTSGPVIERLLREQLAGAASPGLKAAYFVALRGIGQTPEMLAWLTRVWRCEETIAGLTLAEPDFVFLAQALALRDVAYSSQMIEQQIARTMDPDRRARLRFVMPALSADAVERDRFFTSLTLAANRRHEAWVVDGLRCLHHPLRQAASVDYIGPSLHLLQEIQETGDIFFPARWMDATLGGRNSPEAAAIVRAFLAGTPRRYPERLRRIILASADQLFRASGSG
jgi:aminopeptidase N